MSIRPWRDIARRTSRQIMVGNVPVGGDAPVTVQSWSDTLAEPQFSSRAAMAVLGVMGVLAAMLAVTGIFGMAAYNVSRRMKELGIRVAKADEK